MNDLINQLNALAIDHGANHTLRDVLREAARARGAEPVAWQGGLSNEELERAFSEKLPDIRPTDRDLTIFALGIEVGCARPPAKAVPQGLLGSVIAWLKLACENGIDARYEDGTPSANAKQIRTLINDLRAAAALRASPEKVKRIKLDDYSCLELTDYPYENRTELRWWLKRDDSYIRPLNQFEEQFVNCALARSWREGRVVEVKP